MQVMSLIDTTWGHMGTWGWGMAIFGWLSMTILVGLVVWAVASASRSTGASAPNASALDLLDRRYAQGDLDRTEYLQRRKDLEL